MAIVIVVVVVVAVIAAAVYLPKAAKNAGAKAEARLEGLDIKRRDRGHLLGFESKGRPIRGLGILALTPDELVFSQFVVDTDLRIARNTITNVEAVDAFLEKTSPRPLLQVSWVGDEDPDTVAFDVPEAESWAADLRP